VYLKGAAVAVLVVILGAVGWFGACKAGWISRPASAVAPAGAEARR